MSSKAAATWSEHPPKCINWADHKFKEAQKTIIEQALQRVFDWQEDVSEITVSSKSITVHFKDTSTRKYRYKNGSVLWTYMCTLAVHTKGPLYCDLQSFTI